MDANESNAWLRGEDRATVEVALVAALPQFRWFSGKARTVRATSIIDAIPVGDAGCLALAQVMYEQGPSETYVLPLSMATGEAARRMTAQPEGRLIVPLARPADAPAVLYDPLADEPFARALLNMIAAGASAAGSAGQLVGWAGKKFAELRGDSAAPLDIALVKSEQSNSSIIFGKRLILKLFRRMENGPNPELEIGAYLTERAGFAHIAPLAGSLEYRRAGHPAGSVAVLQGFVPNQGDAWQHTLERLSAFFTHGLSKGEGICRREPIRNLLDAAIPNKPNLGLDEAALLGQRTAELHVALARDRNNPEFVPDPFTPDSLRRLHEECRILTQETLGLLADKLTELPSEVGGHARHLLAQQQTLETRFAGSSSGSLSAQRMRCHGDYHLGQVLFTGSDFVILDFEGEPARSLIERRAKHSPLKDVAGMLRSFDYAVHVAQKTYQGQHPKSSQSELMNWGNWWHHWTCAKFLQAYRKTVGDAPILPASADEFVSLLDIYLLEKAIYELKYELNNRPDWVGIPLSAILQIVELPAAA